jgi:hypothetical protein
MSFTLRKLSVVGSIMAFAALQAAPASAAPDDDEVDLDDAPTADKPVEAKAEAKSEAKVEVAPTTAPVPAPVVESADQEEDHTSPLSFGTKGWQASIYGFAELDYISDSTQSYGESATNNTLFRPNTPAGDNPRSHVTARNSRIGFKLQAPAWGEIRTSAVVEFDFFGEQPLTTKQAEVYTAGPARMRQFYVKMETPIVDVLAGQYHDLFAWGGAGFYPNTVAFLSVPGQIYHRNPQLRLSKTLKGGAVDVEIAGAVVRPAQRDAVMPDLQGGLKVNVNGWRGASTPGASRPVSAPLSIGISGLARRFSVTDFAQSPGNPQTATGYGIAANAFLPIIPGNGADLSNALSLTGEFTTGSGIADMYTGLTGGVGFPALPNPGGLPAAPVYTPNIDVGIVTFDPYNRVQPIKWTGVVLNGQYHLPIADGKKLWVSGTFGMLKSSNSVSLTPIQGRPFVFDKAQYFDVNLWWGITPAVQVGVSYQRTQQTFGDGVKAHNDRGQGAFYFFF